MSKIHEALEKAERERKKGLKEEPSSNLLVEKETAEKSEIGFEPAGGERNLMDPKLISLFQLGSRGAEQFRKLRTHLLRFKLHEAPRTILITSATSGEGKSFVAANLAISFSHEIHTHALLVDCDLRNPTLSQWFGMKSGKGLSNYLAGEGDSSELFAKTPVEKLSLLCSGSIQDNPTELIGSRKMEGLIRELKSRYHDQYVIIDTTPLLATSEPEVLAKLVDGIIIVVRAGLTSRETVKQAIANLDKGKIIGFVLNDIEFRSHGQSLRYFGSNGFYYKYGYGKSKPETPRGLRGTISRWVRKSEA
jgi:exopolysaccharide/PEP-CTERM locus tyrosine autokinase